jgi:hypothetical protein
MKFEWLEDVSRFWREFQAEPPVLLPEIKSKQKRNR